MPEKFIHIKGLLLVLVFWISIGSAISDVMFFIQTRELLGIVDSADLKSIYNMTLLLSVAGTLLGFYAAYQLAIKSSHAINLTIYILWFAGPIATFIGLTFIEADPSHLATFIKSCIPAIAWTVYLKRSAYIKSVYVENNQQQGLS